MPESPLSMNEHWSPQYRYCTLCNVNYNFVIKFEEFETEMPSMYSIMGVQKFLNQNYWHNPTPENIYRSYFKTLSDDDIQNLYDIYKYDFELFGYEWSLT